MGNVHEDYKKEIYAIPNLTVGGSTRPDTVGSTGNGLVITSGSDTVTFTILGTRYNSTSFVSEEILVSATSGISSTITDWTNIYGAVMSDKYGLNLSTESADTYFTVSGNTSNEVALISSGYKSTKMVAFTLQGRNITLHNKTGNLYCTTKTQFSGTTPVAPTSNNSFEFTAGMTIEQRVRDYLFIESDTGGATCQVKIWED